MEAFRARRICKQCDGKSEQPVNRKYLKNQVNVHFIFCTGFKPSPADYYWRILFPLRIYYLGEREFNSLSYHCLRIGALAGLPGHLRILYILYGDGIPLKLAPEIYR